MSTTPPKTPTIPQEIEQLQGRARWWEERAKGLEDRILELEGKKRDEETDRQTRDAEFERKAQAELQRARAAAIRALVKLLPEAIRQAKGSPARKGHAAHPPRPALLRLILRSTR